MTKTDLEIDDAFKFIVSGEVDKSDFTCTKCGKAIQWVGRHGICCGIKYGVKQR